MFTLVWQLIHLARARPRGSPRAEVGRGGAGRAPRRVAFPPPSPVVALARPIGLDWQGQAGHGWASPVASYRDMTISCRGGRSAGQFALLLGHPLAGRVPPCPNRRRAERQLIWGGGHRPELNSRRCWLRIASDEYNSASVAVNGAAWRGPGGAGLSWNNFQQ